MDRAFGEAGYIFTSKGWIHLDELQVVEGDEVEVPAGWIKHKDYWLSGEIVRRDAHLRARGMVMGTRTGPDVSEGADTPCTT